MFHGGLAMISYRSPEALVRKYNTRDPFALAWYLDIPVHMLHHPESDLPGLTCLVSSRPSIFINESYFLNIQKEDPSYTDETMEDDILQVGAHELGHAVLHRDELRRAPIKEYEIFNVRSRLEMDANKFAAGIRIDADRMIELFNSDLTLLQVASDMRVNINLLIYKLDEFRKLGYQLPYIPKSNFMGRIHGAGSSEWN